MEVNQTNFRVNRYSNLFFFLITIIIVVFIEIITVFIMIITDDEGFDSSRHFLWLYQ